MKLSNHQWKILSIVGWSLTIIISICWLIDAGNKYTVLETVAVSAESTTQRDTNTALPNVNAKLDSLIQSIQIRNQHDNAQSLRDSFHISHLTTGNRRDYDSAVFYEEERVRLAKIGIAYRVR